MSDETEDGRGREAGTNAAMFQLVTHWSARRLVPPQKRTVAVQLLAGVKGSMAVAPEAGYVRTANGMSSSESARTSGAMSASF